MAIIDKIKDLIPYLPPKDIPHAEKFTAKRDFESLYELVDSAIIKIVKKEKINEENTVFNEKLENLNNLRDAVANYLNLLGGDYFADKFDDDYDDDINAQEIEDLYY